MKWTDGGEEGKRMDLGTDIADAMIPRGSDEEGRNKKKGRGRG
jgi:hypothetical protein